MNCWFYGVAAEGCFYVKIIKSKTHKCGYQVLLVFNITQHVRDINLMELIIKKFGAGIIEKRSNGLAVNLTITKFSDITEIIIPFFTQNNVLVASLVKQFDYQDWCKIANLMSLGSHKTIEGLELIKSIKAGMNTGRK